MLIKQAASVDPADRWSIMVERCTPHTFIFTATPILPRATTVVSQPLRDTHRVGVESLTEPHVEHCIMSIRNERAPELSRKREKWKQELNQSNRFHVVRVRILLCDRKMVNCGYDSHLRLCISPRVRQLPATDSEVPSNFISKADVKVGLSNVIRY